MRNSIRVSVVVEDALRIETDVLALKYAQNLFGVDREVVKVLAVNGLSVPLPSVGEVHHQVTYDFFGAQSVLFVGVKTLREFGYPEIRNFARKVLSSLAEAASNVAHVALTVHGPGYGLDEVESFESELAGIVDALSSGHFPPSLASITFVEQNSARARRLSEVLKRILPDGTFPLDGLKSTAALGHQAQATLRTAGYSSATKPHVFVAMPFAEEMNDVFHYGIQGAVNAAGMLCERADLSTFTGDVMDWVKSRISSATLVVADLSSANPNVYLEIGYAWGRQVPTVLLARNSDDLKFDVKTQRCIIYKSIKALEAALTSELMALAQRAPRAHP